MEKYTLNNNTEIPCIGYGCFPQKETLAVNIPLAIEVGYQLFDTSDNYYNEGILGKVLSRGRLSENSKVENTNPKYTSDLGESGEQITVNTANSSQKWGSKTTINRVFGQPGGVSIHRRFKVFTTI